MMTRRRVRHRRRLDEERTAAVPDRRFRPRLGVMGGVVRARCARSRAFADESGDSATSSAGCATLQPVTRTATQQQQQARSTERVEQALDHLVSPPSCSRYRRACGSGTSSSGLSDAACSSTRGGASMMRRRRALGPRPAQPVTDQHHHGTASLRTEFGDRRRDTMQHSDGGEQLLEHRRRGGHLQPGVSGIDILGDIKAEQSLCRRAYCMDNVEVMAPGHLCSNTGTPLRAAQELADRPVICRPQGRRRPGRAHPSPQPPAHTLLPAATARAARGSTNGDRPRRPATSSRDGGTHRLPEAGAPPLALRNHGTAVVQRSGSRAARAQTFRR